MSGSVAQFIVPAIAALIGGGGLAALIKARPEGSKIVVDAAEGAVVVQTGVITSLEGQVARIQADHDRAVDELNELRGQLGALNSLRTENETLRREQRRLTSENVELRRRVSELEAAAGHQDGSAPPRTS